MNETNNIITLIKNNNTKEAREYIKIYFNNNHKLYNYYMGLSYCKDKKFKTAQKYFQKSIEFGLNSHVLFYNLSVCYMKEESYSLAISCLEKSLQINRTFDKSYINLASIYYSSGDCKKAYRIIKYGLSCCATNKLIDMEKCILDEIKKV